MSLKKIGKNLIIISVIGLVTALYFLYDFFFHGAEWYNWTPEQERENLIIRIIGLIVSGYLLTVGILLPKKKYILFTRKLIFMSLVIFIIPVAIITNPSDTNHKKAVFEFFKEQVLTSSKSTNKWQQLGEAIGLEMGEKIIYESVSSKDYVLFSTTTIAVKDNKRDNIGIGLFGKVWIFNSFEFNF